MKDILRPLLELTVVFPGLLLAYFPVRSYLKQSPARLAAWAVPLLLGLCLGGGLLCYHFCLSTAFPLLLITLAAIFLYLKTLRVSLWKSGTIALAVCAVFACLNSLSRAVGAAITIRLQLPSDKPWFCFSACIFYNIPFRAKLDLPQALPVDEIDTCLVLSNLLENAFEASLHTAPARRQIRITAYVHAERLLLVEVENAFDGEVNEKSGVFRSSKRKENGIGIQSVQHTAEKTGGASTFTYQDGVFSAKVMLCG